MAPRHRSGHYSWACDRMLAFPKNDGLRLDYILATAPLAKNCTAAAIDREELDSGFET
jgi:exonuclease III